MREALGHGGMEHIIQTGNPSLQLQCGVERIELGTQVRKQVVRLQSLCGRVPEGRDQSRPQR
jgi:hypothetical protein